MANLPPTAGPAVPVYGETMYDRCSASGNIGLGEFLVYSGNAVIPTAIAAANSVAARSSAAGFAMESNPIYDSYGNSKTNTALLFARFPILRVSAYDNILASGEYPFGTPVYPAATGSGVNAPTGKTGVGPQWASAGIVNLSGVIGSASASGAFAPPLGIGIVVGLAKLGSGSGNSQLDVLVLPRRPDYF